MAYQQVSTLIDHVEHFHHQVAELYDRLAVDCENARTLMLVEYLAWHERLIERTIAEARANLPDRVSMTWITTTEETTRLADCFEETTVCSHNLTAEAVLEIGMKLDRRVIAVYEELVDRDAPTWVTELFENLLYMEQQQERRMVTQALRGSDL